MPSGLRLTVALATLLIAGPALAQQPGVAKPELLLQQTVEGMPRGERQEIRVLTATLNPGCQRASNFPQLWASKIPQPSPVWWCAKPSPRPPSGGRP
jgi:hypothetical protein